MAYIAKLNPPAGGISEYVNVKQKVGANKDCPNNPSDVQAVQRLIEVIMRGVQETKLGVPTPSGKFDAVTGFHIFFIQLWVKKTYQPGTVVDGCVSPARGRDYGSGVYSILHLNAMARRNDQAGWESVLERFRLMDPNGV